LSNWNKTPSTMSGMSVYSASRGAASERRGFLQDLALFLEHPHLPPQPPQLLPLVARQTLALAGIDLRLLRPQPQRLVRDAQLTRDLPHRGRPVGCTKSM
jgi:hypothetical protein